MKYRVVKQFFMALSLLTLVGPWYSCSDITEMQRDWLDQGERVYVGKLDSLKAHGGLHRIEIVGDTRYTRSAVRCVVKWNDQVREFQMADITTGRWARIMLEDLNEGNHRFFITTYDAAGNRSIIDECFGYSYGDDFILTQSPKRIAEMVPDLQKMTLKWNTTDNAVRVELKYESKDGSYKTLTLDGDVETTEIADWKRGGKIESVTYVLPEKDAIDLVALPFVIQNFPMVVEYEVPKATFKTVTLATDIAGTGYNGIGAKGMWDGIAGNDATKRYHSNNQEGVPHHLTFDMGMVADLSKVKIEGSSDNSFWNPQSFQIWGRETLDDAQTTLPSSDPGWEAQAREKGWVLILDATNPTRISNTHKIVKTEAFKVRYIRYRVTEIVGNPDGSSPHTGKGVYGLCQELTFWANDINFIIK